MLKINSLISISQQRSQDKLAQLAKKAESFNLLQKYWANAADHLIAENSFVTEIKNNQLTVYAHNALVASKIKLIMPQLLGKLEYLQQSQALFRDCKVSLITVKVQVKSSPKPLLKTPRKLSIAAANSLNKFVKTLGDSPLSSKLKSLADKY